LAYEGVSPFDDCQISCAMAASFVLRLRTQVALATAAHREDQVDVQTQTFAALGPEIHQSEVGQTTVNIPETHVPGAISEIAVPVMDEGSGSAPGRTTLDDSDDDSSVSHDSLESMLEVGREAQNYPQLAPEASRFARWWAAQGAETFVQAASLEARGRVRRLWRERYTAERARVRVELARTCTSSLQRRQGAMEETIGLYFLCRCGMSTEQRIFLPYAAANALLDFLGIEQPAMKGTRPDSRRRVACIGDYDQLHPVVQLRMGLWHLDTGCWDTESPASSDESVSTTSVKTGSTRISATSTGSLTRAVGSVRRYVRSLIGPASE
jgi:hypothetical protein